MGRSAVQKKAEETLGASGRSDAMKKRAETMGAAALSAATKKGWKKRAPVPHPGRLAALESYVRSQRDRGLPPRAELRRVLRDWEAEANVQLSKALVKSTIQATQRRWRREQQKAQQQQQQQQVAEEREEREEEREEEEESE